jgi:hypothetical protein
MKLINADELELDTEWDDYYDWFTSYSQGQIDAMEEVKAIPLERLKDFRDEVVNMNSIAIIQRLDKLIEEVEDAKAGNNKGTI